MTTRLLAPVFAATLFLSAFLLFSVQPMVGKLLLPVLGGSPSVWNTAMVFFQVMLLAGYAYAHFVARFLPLRQQAVIHIFLLGIFTLFLPILLPDNLQAPTESVHLAFWQLGVMALMAGGPFFILAASAPIFQHWFAASGHKDAQNPYFLYAVSNAGSLLALLSYPVLIEPFLSVSGQATGWTFLYAALIVTVTACAALTRNGAKPHGATKETKRLDAKTRAEWILLAFVPSSLMLGVTTLITTDLASTPLFWILPLAIYLITFILAFARRTYIPLDVLRALTPYGLALVLLTFILTGFIALKLGAIVLHLVVFFLCALYCHTALAHKKPEAAHLTEYYLLLSVGGALGGIFNALLAPVLFSTPVEYALTLALLAFMIWSDGGQKPARKDFFLMAVGLTLCMATFFMPEQTVQLVCALVLFGFVFVMTRRKSVFAVTCATALLLFHSAMWSSDKTLLDRDRNYFGVLKAYEDKGTHLLYHGTTLHGAQWQRDDYKMLPVTYYSAESGAGDAFDYLNTRKGAQRVAVLGLGAGSVACFSARGRTFDFFEIDPDVVRYAQDPKFFIYLSDCGSPYEIIVGDGRLKIAEKENGRYDLIFLDAFSSDNIPVHLTTQEAFGIYKSKLKPGGIILMNISNRYLDLRPMLKTLAAENDLAFYYKFHSPKQIKDTPSALYSASQYAIFIAKDAPQPTFLKNWKTGEKLPKRRAWTDDYANILSAITF